ncbi:hypothetical protein GW17_00003941 [Ensete ventricosum]|nr:hypothetical protein GW17_00003941 [Ensete ventricosum]
MPVAFSSFVRMSSREVSHSDVGAHCPPNSSWKSTYVESTGATVSMKDAVPSEVYHTYILGINLRCYNLLHSRF